MNSYTVETIKSNNTALKIAIPWDVDESDLAQVKRFVDKLRKDYPNQPWTIYEHIKEAIDY